MILPSATAMRGQSRCGTVRAPPAQLGPFRADFRTIREPSPRQSVEDLKSEDRERARRHRPGAAQARSAAQAAGGGDRAAAVGGAAGTARRLCQSAWHYPLGRDPAADQPGARSRLAIVVDQADVL